MSCLLTWHEDFSGYKASKRNSHLDHHSDCDPLIFWNGTTGAPMTMLGFFHNEGDDAGGHSPPCGRLHRGPGTHRIVATAAGYAAVAS